VRGERAGFRTGEGDVVKTEREIRQAVEDVLAGLARGRGKLNSEAVLTGYAILSGLYWVLGVEPFAGATARLIDGLRCEQVAEELGDLLAPELGEAGA
jgi:hypothetical protein